MVTKKHIQQKDYSSWVEQFSLFEALSSAESELLETTPQEFQNAFPAPRLFPDPFLKTNARQAANRNLKDAVIMVGGDKMNQKIAERLCNQIDAKYNIRLKIVLDTTELDFWGMEEPVILIGGTQYNGWSQKLGQRLQLGVFNRDFPGQSGWGVTTYQGIQANMGMRYILAGDSDTGNLAVDYFLQHAIALGEVPQLRWVHHVRLDSNLPPEFHNLDIWFRHYPSTSLDQLDEWLNSDHQRPYRELFAAVLLPMRQGPIIANSALLDVGVSAIRYYQLTGNEKALHVFREMLWGFWEYLNSDDPNIYISDMDFRLGQICAYWSWIEFHPAITDQERRTFPQLLLAAMRMVHAYYLEKWSTAETPPGVRHNHQTFKGRCLLYGWRYFHQLKEPDAEAWKRDADILFEGMDVARTKYAENAKTYETFAPEHLLAWHEISQREISMDFQHALAAFARREWALTDNFCYRVEYGDCDVSFHKQKPFQAAAWMDATNSAFGEIIELERNTAGIFPPEIPHPIYSFGSFQAEPTAAGFNHLFTGWTRLFLESKLQQQCLLYGSSDQWFDKLVWRSGWQDTSSYLALEGFGNKTISHSHNAVNSVIRANWAGRIWLVGNGYGKRIGVTSAAEAFSTREVGPVDHNMLILRDADGQPVIPPMNALLVDYGESPLPFAVTELRDYAGCRWVRHVFFLKEAGLIVVDSLISETSECLKQNFSVEWNILGDVTQKANGAVIEQTGVKTVFQHFETAEVKWDRNASASWQRVMDNNEYPYTSNSLEKCTLTPPLNEHSNAYHFASGFWLEQDVRNVDWNSETLTLRMQLRQQLFNNAKYVGSWGSVLSEGSLLQITLSKVL